MTASAGNPLSGKIELPAAFNEALGEYRKAIAGVKKDLKELEAYAKDSLRTRGIIDEATQRQITGLRAAERNLQGSLDRQKEERESALAETMAQKQANALQDLAQRAGMSGGTVARTLGHIRGLSKVPGQIAKTAEDLGFKGLGPTAQAIESAMGSLLRRLPFGAAGGPAGVAVAAAAYLTEQAITGQTRGIVADAKAAEDRASSYFALTGGGSYMSMETGSAERAQRVFSNQEAARARGMDMVPLAGFDLIRSWFGAKVEEQGAEALEQQRFQAKVEESRQRFGLQYDPRTNPMVRKRADRAFNIKTSFLQDPWNASKILANTVYYQWFRPFGLAGGGVEAGNKYLDKLYDAELRAATEKEIEAEGARRKNEESVWNAGAAGALRRVLENEKRRWLRAVEQDRASRFASWSMT
jgi:hypothetical protein